MIESAFKYQAHSRAAAHGFWQFIDGTGRRYGLHRTRAYDERSDAVKSTRAAAALLPRPLRDVRRLVPRHGGLRRRRGQDPQEPPAHRREGLLAARPGSFLRRETRDYVPFVLATALIAKDPARFGFDVVPDPPLAWDVVTGPRPVDLARVAEAVGATAPGPPAPQQRAEDPRRRRTASPSIRPPGPARNRAPLVAARLPASRRRPKSPEAHHGPEGRHRWRRSRRAPASASRSSATATTSRARRSSRRGRSSSSRRRSAAPEGGVASAKSVVAPRERSARVPTPAAAITRAADVRTVRARRPSTRGSRGPAPARVDIPAEGFVDRRRRRSSGAVAAARTVRYTVRPGDTLYRLAARYGTTVDAIDPREPDSRSARIAPRRADAHSHARRPELTASRSMTVARAYSAAVVGLDGADRRRRDAPSARACPGLTIVGLPDAAVKESRERIRSALRHVGFPLPGRNVVVNLAPADLPKSGHGARPRGRPLDPRGQRRHSRRAALGRHARRRARPRRRRCGRCPASSPSRRRRAARGAVLLVPAENAAEAAALPATSSSAPVPHLGAAIAHLLGREVAPALRRRLGARGAASQPSADLADVRGQAVARRALEIAAAGGHNLLMTGPPGAGKTMLARRLPGLLPPLSREESLEVTRIWSVSGRLPARQRPPRPAAVPVAAPRRVGAPPSPAAAPTRAPASSPSRTSASSSSTSCRSSGATRSRPCASRSRTASSRSRAPPGPGPFPHAFFSSPR